MVLPTPPPPNAHNPTHLSRSNPHTQLRPNASLAGPQGNMARDLTGKFVGIFLPNSAFVSM